MERLKQLYALTDFCLSSPISTLVCHDFWMLIAEVAIGICLLGVAICIKVYISHELEFRRNKKLVDHRKLLADPETMQKNTWKGLDLVTEEHSQEQLAQQFRAALKPDQEKQGT